MKGEGVVKINGYKMESTDYKRSWPMENDLVLVLLYLKRKNS